MIDGNNEHICQSLIFVDSQLNNQSFRGKYVISLLPLQDICFSMASENSLKAILV